MRRTLAILVLLYAEVGGQQTKPAPPSPVAERAGIRLLAKARAEGNAVLYMQFAAARPADRVIKIDVGKRSTSLRDDGVAPDEKADDGIHSAFVRIDPKELAEMRQGLLRAKSLPIFIGRELIGMTTAQTAAAALSMKDIPLLPTSADFRGAMPVLLVAPAFPPVSGVSPVYPVANASDVDVEDSVFITKTSVVDDPERTYPCRSSKGSTGEWTFGHLISELVEGTSISAEDFVRTWLASWQNPQTVNTFTVAARPEVANNFVLRVWKKNPDGTLDMAKAPFKLLAIVNRIDLGEPLWSGRATAGEARFIFTLQEDCTPLRFLVIFEYKVNLHGCEDVKAWARQWDRLKGPFVTPGSANAALEEITVQFTEAGTTRSQKPNRSSLSQVRTNELLQTKPWELREFRLNSDGYLTQVTVKQTPDLSFDQSALLRSYAQTNRVAIIADDYTVPDQVSGTPFLGGDAPVQGDDVGGRDTNAIFFWRLRPPSPTVTIPDLRHHVSLNTCNGCHGAETATRFAHVDEFGVLSGFLTGIKVRDPAGETYVANVLNSSGGKLHRAGEPVIREFNDLLRRQERMAQILTWPCFMDVLIPRLRMTH